MGEILNSPCSCADVRASSEDATHDQLSPPSLCKRTRNFRRKSRLAQLPIEKKITIFAIVQLNCFSFNTKDLTEK